MIVRLFAILVSLPMLAIGAFGLGSAFAAEAGFVALLGGWIGQALEAVGQPGLRDTLAGVVPGGVASAVGGLALFVGARPSRGTVAEDAPVADDGVAAASGVTAPSIDKRSEKKASKHAAALAKKGNVLEAAEFAFASGALDTAADYFEQAEQYVRAAEIRHDQNRMTESAALYIRAGQHETAGTILAAAGEHAEAADCYSKAGRMSVAAEMYEKAGNHLRAGECYAECEFQRHAAQAFVRAQDWGRAAAALEEVINEETRRTGTGGSSPDLRKLVMQAAKLYEQAQDLGAAQRVLVRGELWAPAAQIAMRCDDHAAAADYFQRAGDPTKAAECLRTIGEEQAAAQLLGEHFRDKGDDEEAARLLVQAGDYLAAGDLYRKLEDYKLAAECFERQGDLAQAAEMFRLGGDWGRAITSYERIGRYEDAAECATHLGDPAREAGLLAQAGRLARAGELYAREGLDDDAIKVLQQVPSTDPEFPGAAALLGEIFQAKGKHTLAVKKLSQAIGNRELEPDTVALFYALATAQESAGQVHEACELYEKILGADYHYKDVQERLVRVRDLATSLPPAGATSGFETQQGGQTGKPGRYQIVGELGRGGMGIVYEAKDTTLDRTVAFKVLPDTLKDNPQALKNFLREAKSAAKLNHPNIVTVFDAGEQDGRYYIALEYVDGTTLKEIVRRRGVISQTGVLHVAVQMCEALSYAHEQKVIHRDIKTANTMWTRDRKAKIMDFGLAKVVEEVRNHTTLVSGTPYYMSPEQTLGKNVDHRTDIYSLGVTLFELATGTLPFREGNVPYHHVHTPAPDPRTIKEDLSPQITAIILKCLQKDPADRYQSAGELVQRVRALIAKASPAS